MKVEGHMNDESYHELIMSREILCRLCLRPARPIFSQCSVLYSDRLQSIMHFEVWLLTGESQSHNLINSSFIGLWGICGCLLIKICSYTCYLQRHRVENLFDVIRAGTFLYLAWPCERDRYDMVEVDMGHRVSTSIAGLLKICDWHSRVWW